MSDPFALDSNADDWEFLPEVNTTYQMQHVPLNHDKPKRSGKTPEALVTAKIYGYLKIIGAIVIRTNSGSWQSSEGHHIQGAKAGTSDLTVCLPQPHEGAPAPFCGIEVKKVGGIQSEAQKRYQKRVESLGGLYILAESARDVQAAFVNTFGIDVVMKWEQHNVKQ